jgi:hypothetical protein
MTTGKTAIGVTIGNTIGTAVGIMTNIPAVTSVGTAVRTGIRGMAGITVDIPDRTKAAIMIGTKGHITTRMMIRAPSPGSFPELRTNPQA